MNATASLFLLAAWCLGLSCLGTWLFIRWARSGRHLVLPNDRSSHQGATPNGGGIAFLAAFLATATMGTALGYLSASPSPWVLLLLSAPLILVGQVDDHRPLPVWVRLAVQGAVACCAVLVFDPLSFPYIGLKGALFATVFLLVLMMNLYNFMDGMDGLVAGMSLVQAGFFAYWLNQPVWWLLSASLAGFLVWNRPRARVFMGDTASVTLGALLGFAMINKYTNPAWQWPYHAVLLPLLGDACYTLARRLIRGENILRAHHSHLYQRLFRCGLSHGAVTSIYVGLTLVCGLLASVFKAAGVGCSLAVLLAFLVWAEVHLSRAGIPFTRPVPSKAGHEEKKPGKTE